MKLAEVSLKDEAATASLGAALAPLLAAGDVVRLKGDLGAGKSTLARSVIRALTGAAEAPSPTFTLVEAYEAKDFKLWHFDLYRLDAPNEVWELGLEEALDEGVSLIEWPERIDGLLPSGGLTLALEIRGDTRHAILSGDTAWAERLHNAGIS